MISRTLDRFGLYPERLVADTAYGAAETLCLAGPRARGSSRTSR